MPVRTFACSWQAAENLMDAVYLRARSRSREPGPGDGPPDAVVLDVQRRRPLGLTRFYEPLYQVYLLRSGQRVDDATRWFSASDMTARATAAG